MQTSKQRLEKARAAAAAYLVKNPDMGASSFASWRGHVRKPFAAYCHNSGTWGMEKAGDNQTLFSALQVAYADTMRPGMTADEKEAAQKVNRDAADAYNKHWRSVHRLPRGHETRPSESGEFYCDKWPSGWRELGDANTLARLDHTGWYCDDGRELAKGYVLQLPASAARKFLEARLNRSTNIMSSRAHTAAQIALAKWRDGFPNDSYDEKRGCYIAGVYQTECDGVTLYLGDFYDTADEAARAADGHAESMAETCREYYENPESNLDTLGTTISEARSELADTVKQTNAIVSELRVMRRVAASAGTATPTLCKMAVARLDALRESARESVRTIREAWGNVETIKRQALRGF